MRYSFRLRIADAQSPSIWMAGPILDAQPNELIRSVRLQSKGNLATHFWQFSRIMCLYLTDTPAVKRGSIMSEALGTWNRLAKRQDQLYHRCAKRAGLTDAQFWVLYALCEEKQPLSQNTYCEDWCYSKQTVNTAVAGLERMGLVSLSFVEGSRKQKALRLTAQGERFCQKQIRSLQESEEKVLAALSSQDRNEFLRLFEALLTGLESELAPPSESGADHSGETEAPETRDLVSNPPSSD